MFTFIGAPNPTLNLSTSEQYKTHTGKYKCSHMYLLQKLTLNKQYKNITKVMLHSKSSEAIRSLYAKKRVKHKVLIAENDSAPLTRSHLI